MLGLITCEIRCHDVLLKLMVGHVLRLTKPEESPSSFIDINKIRGQFLDVPCDIISFSLFSPHHLSSLIVRILIIY